MQYNWLQALEMVANGQPMHVVGRKKYLKIGKGQLGKYSKDTNWFIGNLFIDKEFMSEMYEPYHKQIELTEDEKVILRNVCNNFKWIARDGSEFDNDLCLYISKPHKATGAESWQVNEYEGSLSLTAYTHLFPQIKWEDEEPKLIADLIK